VILFDEVARLEFSRNHATLSLLKDYMESGQFSRGRSSYGADTSLVFMGNLDVEGNRPADRYRHLFQVLPSHLQDTAVLDRLHSFIPGWELPKLTPDALNVGLALASDYFGEVLLALRDWAYDGFWTEVLRRWPFRPGLTQRDVVALDRVGRAFFKLVFPDGVIDEEVAVELLSVISEGRQRIHDQLVKMEPGEFAFRPVGFEGVPVVSDDALAVETERDRVMNRSPQSGQSTGAAGSLDPVSGGVNSDVVVIQAVMAQEASSRRPLILADEGLVGVDSAWHTVRFYLDAHRHSLGLDSRVRWEGLGVQLSGGPGDVRGRAELALMLGVVSAWLDHPLKPALAALGGLTLSGEVTVPPEMLALTMAVLSRGRDIIMLPSQSPLSLIEDTFAPHFPRLTLVPIDTVEDALRYSFRK
jgi:ATP-dependent Lon protease